MAVRVEKETGDIVIDGFEKGIAASPHAGLANIQNANIATQSGEVMASFTRTQQTMTNSSATGSLTFVDTNHVGLSIASTNNLFKGNWITVSGSSNTAQLPNGTYYVPPSTGSNFQLANYYNTMNYTPTTVSISTLVVGGGGGGGSSTGNSGAGGGGAGGVKTGTASIQTGTAYTVTIGGGGGAHANGSSSILSGGVISTVTADGGGGGGNGPSNSAQTGLAGGSGGGGGAQTNDPSTLGTGGAGTAGEGNNGGSANSNLTIQGGAGGGGAGGIGADKNQSGGIGGGGAGGVGVSNSISGSAVFYGGGGGGNCNNGGGLGQGAGGNGGGGAGGQNTTGGAGTANTGGGGGGGNGGGTGGSGIVIISVPVGQLNVGSTTGGTHTTSGGNDIWTFTASGTWTPVIATIIVPAVLTGFTAGLTASFTMVATMGAPIAQATETYYLVGVPYHRYYILDNQNLVWVYDDQNEVLYSSTDNVNWFLPDKTTNWCTRASGIGVISGFLIGATEQGMFGKPVVALGNTNVQTTTWVQFPDYTAWSGTARNTTPNHFCFVGHQGIMYVTDGSYLASVFPDSTIALSGVTGNNVQALANWTVTSGSAGASIDYSVISGVTIFTTDSLRVPVVFFTPNTGVLPTAITAGTVYYMFPGLLAGGVYAAPTGGSTIDMQTGASGPQYFSTFYPIASDSSAFGAHPTWVSSPQRLTLPKFEVAQCIAEIGNQALIGCTSNIVYPWDQVSNLPGGLINLPESNVTNIITVNQMGYIFAGNKANIYITDGSQASQVLSVPDYAAGVPGTPSTYIEPQFTWGGGAYIRGRVYFSLIDQTATKAGNCGGVWSFIPTQNLYIGQDTGIALRLENQNSYATYNGYAPILITRLNQVSGPPLYWSAWKSTITSPSYGIDYTSLSTLATSVAIIETEVIPAGTFLNKKTDSNIEYKVATPLLTGETVTIQYRTGLTDTWTSCGTVITETTTVSGYYKANFQKTQWLQLRVTLTPQTGTSGSFVRLTELRIR